jgi:hypothetical protein
MSKFQSIMLSQKPWTIIDLLKKLTYVKLQEIKIL